MPGAPPADLTCPGASRAGSSPASPATPVSTTYIFYSSDDSCGPWFGLQLARGLAEHRMRVRLFCHDVPALSVAQAHLDPRVVIQHLGQVEVLDHRLARNVGAARNLVDLFGAVPPAAYMARYFSQPTSGNRYSLHAPWSTQDAGTPILLRSQTQTHRHFDLHLGDSPQTAGLIRSFGHSHLLRNSPHSTLAARASLLSLLGLPSDLISGERSLYLSASPSIAWPKWLQSLIEGETTHCLFIEYGELQQHIAPIFSRVPGQPGTSSLGGLTVVFLPPLLWALEDEVLTLSDLVLTDRTDVAFRAAERGTPAIRARLSSVDTDLTDWCFGRTQTALAEVHRQAANSFGSGRSLVESFDAVMARLADFKAHARQLQTRIGRAPDLVSMMLTASDISSATHVERLFAPTEPNPML